MLRALELYRVRHSLGSRLEVRYFRVRFRASSGLGLYTYG
jgi:hypothetical protein